MFKWTKLKSPPARVVLVFLEIFFCIGLFIGLTFCVFPSLGDSNTYTVEVNVTGVEYESGGRGKHRDTNKLIVYTEGDLYVVDMGMIGSKYVSSATAKELKERLLSGDKRFEFVVWEHIPTRFMPRNSLFWVKQAVGIKQSGGVVWDIEHTNEYHRDRRVDSVIVWSVVGIIWFACEIFIYGHKIKLSIRRLARIIRKKYKAKSGNNEG